MFNAVLLLTIPSLAPADETPFSGPQKGEKLPALKVKGVFGDEAGKELDLIQQAGEKPVVLIFVHKRTRPAFGLMNAVMKYAAERSKDGLASGVVFLTDDVTATDKWLNVVKRHLSEKITYGISADGVEGPGAYGLNRNVTLTVLVGNEGKTTANFALVQPSVQADGPKIFQAIVDQIGGEAPKIAAYQRRPNDAKKNMKRGSDPGLESRLRAVINKQATPEQVKDAVAEVEKYIADKEVAKRNLARIASTIVNSGRLENYGTEAAQEALRAWNKQYGHLAPAKETKRQDEGRQSNKEPARKGDKETRDKGR